MSKLNFIVKSVEWQHLTLTHTDYTFICKWHQALVPLYSKCHLWQNGCFSHTFSVLLDMSPSPTGLGGYRFPNASFVLATQVSPISDDRVTIFTPTPVWSALIYLFRGLNIRNDLEQHLSSWRSKEMSMHMLVLLVTFQRKPFTYNSAALWQAGKPHTHVWQLAEKLHTSNIFPNFMS